MARQAIENPIINGPYDAPERHWHSFEGKAIIADWLAANCDATNCKKWADLLDDLDARIDSLTK